MRLLLLALAVPALLTIACSAQDPQNTLAPAGDVARMQANLYWTVFWWAVGVFVVVEGLLLYTILRFRRRPGDEIPRQLHGNVPIEVAWTIAPAVVLFFIGVPTIQTLFRLAEPPASEGPPLQVKVIGHQWWWEFQYPDLGIVTANELHIPINQPVFLTLESADVIHSFWVPKLAGKTDVIPTRSNTMWLNAREEGNFYGQCAELCGEAHAHMRFRVIAESRSAFDAWVRLQRQLARPPTDPLAQEGAQIFTSSGICYTCHTVAGTQAQGKVGPDLTHIASRTTIAAGIMENNEENLRRWLRNPQAVKPGNFMRIPPLTEDQITKLIAYLRSLQ